MFTYFTNFWKQPLRGVLLKNNTEKICKTHKKASFVESFLVLWSCWLQTLQLYKEELRYSCFYDGFSENFQNDFYTKTAPDGCFYNFNLTLWTVH